MQTHQLSENLRRILLEYGEWGNQKELTGFKGFKKTINNTDDAKELIAWHQKYLELKAKIKRKALVKDFFVGLPGIFVIGSFLFLLMSVFFSYIIIEPYSVIFSSMFTFLFITRKVGHRRFALMAIRRNGRLRIGILVHMYQNIKKLTERKKTA